MERKVADISVIIPVYNEEDRIKGCLGAITNQAVQPREIIVVDNNSTDQTVAIANNFSGIKIIKEPKQGIAYARDAGFKVAKGSILARIDADAFVPTNWVQLVDDNFKSDKNIGALSGYGYSRTGLTNKYISRLISWAIHSHGKALFGATMVWGSNMAIKKSVWQKISKDTIADSAVHEDIDIALALASHGYKVKVDKNLVVNADLEEVQRFSKYMRYYKMVFNNLRYHKNHPRSEYKSMKRINFFIRAYHWLITAPFVGLFVILTFLNSIYYKIRQNLFNPLVEIIKAD
ncbi:glycosyltransferase family 2 protein [Candidatus Saccharibacteria bacterium]|jgi:glycosyltransferase involved in cell wall biosynthesis|nr:glycosyltransferase family 2 protein [Candidatus Saccharibacteria bacterium]HOR23207.1 glycosyltransferase family 2 protein [Candidatus Saccharibacteria bacterium]HPW48134.1 glycosyltransferase family 2 protein [Candidatus Saccharibacteria bacterium]